MASFNLNQKKTAFTLVELLVVIAIIGLLSSLSVIALNSARAKTRDAKRVADLKQVSTALELFYNDMGRYPTDNEWNAGSLFNGTTTYLAYIPVAPNPPDGTCDSGTNAFAYSQTNSGASYEISFCIGSNVGAITSGGDKCLTPAGFLDVNCSGGGGGGGGSTFVGFTNCGDTGVYGGQSYPTVNINGQCVMTKNLNIGDYIGRGASINGYDGIGGTNDDCVDVSYQGWEYWSCQGASSIQKYCYGNDQNNCTSDGALYEWAEAVGLPADCNGINADAVDNGNNTYTLTCPVSGSHTILAKQQGICPDGWHVFTDAELYNLENYFTDNGQTCDAGRASWDCLSAGDKLKEASGCSQLGDPSCNSSGLSFPLSGHLDFSGGFSNLDNDIYLWSATPYSTSVFTRYMNFSHATIIRGTPSKTHAYSVRCIQD